MTGTKTVSAHVTDFPPAGTARGLLHDIRNWSRIKTATARDKSVTIDTSEDRGGFYLCLFEPHLQCADRADVFVFGIRDPDLASGALLICLAPTQRTDHALTEELQIFRLRPEDSDRRKAPANEIRSRALSRVPARSFGQAATRWRMSFARSASFLCCAVPSVRLMPRSVSPTTRLRVEAGEEWPAAA